MGLEKRGRASAGGGLSPVAAGGLTSGIVIGSFSTMRTVVIMGTIP